MARSSTFTQQKADKICDLIAEGLSLRKICLMKEMPDLSTARRWLVKHEAFRLQYAHAREDQADYYADDIIDVADDETKAPDERRVMIDARKWKASKLAPKKYGDKLLHGGDADNPVKFEQIKRVIINNPDT